MFVRTGNTWKERAKAFRTGFFQLLFALASVMLASNIARSEDSISQDFLVRGERLEDLTTQNANSLRQTYSPVVSIYPNLESCISDGPRLEEDRFTRSDLQSLPSWAAVEVCVFYFIASQSEPEQAVESLAGIGFDFQEQLDLPKSRLLRLIWRNENGRLAKEPIFDVIYYHFFRNAIILEVEYGRDSKLENVSLLNSMTYQK